MEKKQNYQIVDMDKLKVSESSCGTSKRAFLDDSDRTASLHIVDIKEDVKTHYHKKLTEIYYILEGEGHMELDGNTVPVTPNTSILIKPGCRHRAIGDLKILITVIPAFDPEDEWFD